MRLQIDQKADVTSFPRRGLTDAVGHVSRSFLFSARPLCVLLLATLMVGCFLSEEDRALRELQTAGIPATTASVFRALETNDHTLLQLLLRISVSLEGKNERRQTPLMSAICLEDHAATGKLIPLTPADQLGEKDENGITALGYAVTQKNHELVARLLHSGAIADVAANPEGETSIAFAVRESDLLMIRMLLEHIESTESLHEPLAAAVRAENLEIAQLLLEAGAEPNHVSSADQRSPIANAVALNNVRLATMLVSDGATMLRDEETILEPDLVNVAFDHGNIEMIRLLLTLNAPLTCRGKNGLAPLRRAIDQNNEELVELFLRHGAPPEDNLFIALEKRNRKWIDLLLANGASLDSTNAAGDTPLHTAIASGDDAIISQILESEPDLDLTGRHGQTAFAIACAQQNLPLMKTLLQCGADPNQVFAHEGSKDTFKEMIPSKRFLFYLKRDRGLTPIMLAAAVGNVNMTRLLVDHGASRFKTSRKYRRWPVNFACESEHIKCAQLLLGRDIDSPRNVHIVISLSNQKAVLYKDGKPAITSTVSTGRKGYRTPAGKFLITNKTRHHTSSIYGSPMPYFQRLSCKDFGFHVGACPGYPASHGCIRMPRSKAVAFYKSTRLGDPVEIIP